MGIDLNFSKVQLAIILQNDYKGLLIGQTSGSIYI